ADARQAHQRFRPGPQGRAVIWQLKDVPWGKPKSGSTGSWQASEKADEKPWAVLPHAFPVRWASWSPDGRFVVTASADDDSSEGEILLWDVGKSDESSRDDSRNPIRLDDTGRGILTAFSLQPGALQYYIVAVVERDRKRQGVKIWKLENGVLASDGNGSRGVGPALVSDWEIAGNVNWLEFRPAAERRTPIFGDRVSAEFAIAGVRDNGSGFAQMYDASATSTAAVSRAVTVETNLAEPGVLAAWPHAAAVSYAAFSPDGRRFATASQNQIRVFDLEDWNSEPLWMREHRDNVLHIVFSPDSQLVVSSSRDNTAQVWRAANGAWQNILRHDRWIYWSQFSPDGRYVLTCGRDQVAKVWDISDVGTAVPVAPPLNHAGAVQQAYFSLDGAYVLTRSWSLLRLWSLATDNPPSSIFRSDMVVKATDHSENGRCIAMISQDDDGRRWQVQARDLQENCDFQADLPHAMDSVWIGDDGRFFLVAGRGDDDGQISARVYTLGTDTKSTELKFPAESTRHAIKLARFVQIGERPVLITAGCFAQGTDTTQAGDDLRIKRDTECVVRFWDAESGRMLSEDTHPAWGEARFLAISRDGRHVALATAYEDPPNYMGKVLLWTIRTGSGDPQLKAVVHPIEQEEGSAIHAAFNHDASRLLTTSNADKDCVILW
ncbi:MAG: hypothetical protein JJ992_18615, partial [Planctomycetes bacterium]|nr:hypothetical protein [Planctomycetota bacterium]